MPVFAGLFLSLFTSLAGFFAAWMTKKAAFAVAAIATLAILTVAFTAVIATSINAALAWPSLPAGVVFGFKLFMPTNFPALCALTLAADTTVTIYKWNVENLRLASYIT